MWARFLLRAKDVVKEWVGIEVKMGWSVVKYFVGYARASVGSVDVSVVGWAVCVWVLWWLFLVIVNGA